MMGRMGRGVGRSGVVLVGVLSLAACGAEGGPADDPVLDRPLTAPALAWLVDEHIKGDAASARPTYDSRTLGQAAVAVDLRFRPSPGDDGELVRAFVADWRAPEVADHRSALDCAEAAERCAVVDGVTLRWEEMVPEEDPGYVSVLRRDGDRVVFALSAGSDVAGDPREADLPVSVDDLVALVTDPRLAFLTTDEAVAEGSHFEVYDDPATPGRDLPDTEFSEPTTDAALALLAQDHTAWEAGSGGPDAEVDGPGVGAVLDFPAQGGWESTTLRVSLTPVATRPSDQALRRIAGCAGKADGCGGVGSALVAWTLAAGGDPGSTTVVAWRGGALLEAAWSGQPVVADPRHRDGPVLVREIVALCDDTHLGLLTSPDLAERAAEMPGWWQGDAR